MAYKTYFKFFRETNYTFRKPKSDVCHYCTEMEQKLSVNPNDECHLQYIHKRKVQQHLKLKSDYISKCKEEDSDTLVVEFDYSQNFPLPKLNVTKQFFKRLIWLFVFNIHIHNDDSSFYYTFLEYQAKKGANSVALFL